MKPPHESNVLLRRIAATIKAHHILTPGARILAAVSGGVDSMVMLDVLCRLGYRVEAAHFDHQTRDGASTEDAAFVQQMCAEKNTPCYLASEPVLIAAKEAGRSFEEYARKDAMRFS